MYKGKGRQELEKEMKMEGHMSEVLAKLSSILGNSLNVRYEIWNEVKIFWNFILGSKETRNVIAIKQMSTCSFTVCGGMGGDSSILGWN